MGSLPNPHFGWLFLCKILWGYIYSSSAAIPTAIVTRCVLIFTYIAIPRYRLFDIDGVINRNLVYSSLIATLVVLYFGVIVSLQSVFAILTGQTSTLAVVVSTLCEVFAAPRVEEAALSMECVLERVLKLGTDPIGHRQDGSLPRP